MTVYIDEIFLENFILNFIILYATGLISKSNIKFLKLAVGAILGSIYKSCGFESAKNCIYKIYNQIELDISSILYLYNSKELLQQYTQSKNKDLPEYKIIKETGEAHNKNYEIGVYYNGTELGTGIGKTKKEAEKQAALMALKNLNII